jgi:hypothetical protein
MFEDLKDLETPMRIIGNGLEGEGTNLIARQSGTITVIAVMPDG